MRRWDEEVKPDSVARNRKLQNTSVTALGDSEFLAYLEDVGASAAEIAAEIYTGTTCCSRTQRKRPRQFVCLSAPYATLFCLSPK